MEQEDLEGALYLIMLMHPLYAYILPDGTALYVMANGKDLIRIEGEGLNRMSPEEINLFIQASLS